MEQTAQALGHSDDSDERDECDADDEPDRGALGVACGPVRRAIAERRTPTVRADVQRALQEMRREVRHRYIPLRELVAFVRPAEGQGRPADREEQRQLDRRIAMAFCDPLHREVQIRHYLGAHPEYLTPGGGP